MRRARFAICFLGALSLALPPTVFADVVCNTYPFTTPIYYPENGYTACSGWSPWNCTECSDTSSGDSCWTNSSSPCDPVVHRN